MNVCLIAFESKNQIKIKANRKKQRQIRLKPNTIKGHLHDFDDSLAV